MTDLERYVLDLSGSPFFLTPAEYRGSEKKGVLENSARIAAVVLFRQLGYSGVDTARLVGITKNSVLNNWKQRDLISRELRVLRVELRLWLAKRNMESGAGVV